MKTLPPLPSRRLLILEFIFLFLLLPVLLYAATMFRVRLVLPAVGLLTIYAFWILLRTPSFDRRSLYALRPIKKEIGPILSVFIPGGLGLSVAVWWFFPDIFLAFPRQKPLIWALVMLIYPILSVYPQQIIYRAFLFHRYALFHEYRAARFVILSTLVFGFLHIVYLNAIAVALTTVGGSIFALTWWRGRSVMACWLEHALWGNLVFTLGLGTFLYYHPEKPVELPKDSVEHAITSKGDSGSHACIYFHPRQPCNPIGR